MPGEIIRLSHIFIDHSNIWGGSRLATKIRKPSAAEDSARISVRALDQILGGRHQGVSAKVVSGGVPPGMEGLWQEYTAHGYDTQRLFRDTQWKERGVDHAIIGHMWRLIALHANSPINLVLASGDGKKNEFGTSFYEVLHEILAHPTRFPNWQVQLASFDWKYPDDGPHRPPTNVKMRTLVETKPGGSFTNLMDNYSKLVYLQK